MRQAFLLLFSGRMVPSLFNTATVTTHSHTASSLLSLSSLSGWLAQSRPFSGEREVLPAGKGDEHCLAPTPQVIVLGEGKVKVEQA